MAGENYSTLLKAITATEPTFNFSLRGYDRKQVDHYAHTTEQNLAAALAENRHLAGQVTALADELRALREEAAELRRRPTAIDKISYRHLGVRVEQILCDAEEQAELTRRDAVDEADRVRSEADEFSTRLRSEALTETTRLREETAQDVARQRAEAAAAFTDEREQLDTQARLFREHEDQVRAELEQAQLELVAEERRADERVAWAAAEVARAESELDRLRMAAEELLASAQAEYERVTTSAMETAERVHAELAVHAQTVRQQAYDEATGMTQAARSYADQTIAEAEQHAIELNKLIEGYRDRVQAITPPEMVKPKHSRELSPASMRALTERPAEAATADAG
jgi:cell division septum initiation protein DivIVA